MEFARRHSGSRDPYIVEAIRAIHAGSVALRELSEGTSSRELARTYALRSGIAESQGRHSVAAAMLSLSEQCKVNDESPCSIWLLEGAISSFAIFELMPSRTVAGCLRFEGALGAERDGA